jgi:hypothetical protein
MLTAERQGVDAEAALHLGVSGALDYLRSFRPDARSSLEHLTWLAGVLERLALFRVFFPEEFAATSSGALRREEETGHSAGELRLVELINRHLFPADERMTEIEGGLATVPVESYLADEPESIEDVEWMKLGYRVGVVLMNFVEVGVELLECLPLGREGFRDLRLVSPYAVDFDELARLCESADGPLKYLATSVRSARRDTGNVFFDGLCMCGQCGSSIEWTEENLRLLADAWVDAQGTLAEMYEFSDWLDEDPETRLRRVVELWNRAEKKEGGATCLRR